MRPPPTRRPQHTPHERHTRLALLAHSFSALTTPPAHPLAAVYQPPAGLVPWKVQYGHGAPTQADAQFSGSPGEILSQLCTSLSRSMSLTICS